MKGRVGLAVVTVVASTIGFAAPPAAAAGSGLVQFRCEGVMPTWPSPGNSTVCEGTANLAWTDGQFSRTCLPECDFRMTINHSNVCFLGEPSILATFQGTMTVVGGGQYDYRATVAGPFLTFTPPQVAGEGVMLYGPMIPTCNNPGPMAFQLVGAFTPSP